MKYTQYIGILLGAMYGLGYRMLCGNEGFKNLYDNYNIYSISFIWIVPIVISIVPILFARDEILRSKLKQFLFPILSVLLFFIFALSMGLEDWLCIIIIAFPFLISAGIIGLLTGILIKYRKAKGLYSILFLPLVLNPIESLLPNHKEYFKTTSTVIIDATPSQVWNNLIEVPEITEEEYKYGFFNYLGVPRPIKSELEIINGQQYRIGYFTGGLKLYESLSDLDSLHFVSFKIHIDKSKLRDLPTDKHLLNSRYFKFENISYRLVKLNNGKTKLNLNCDYIIESKMNFYANFWAERVVKDFEVRLLEVLKNKIEKQTPSISDCKSERVKETNIK